MSSTRPRRQTTKSRRRSKKLSGPEPLEPRMMLAADEPDSGLAGAATTMSPLFVDRPNASTSDVNRADAGRQIVFVDRGVEGYRVLVDAILGSGGGNAMLDEADLETVLLDSDRDGVEQITEYLRGTGNVSAIHILSHGSAGGLQLGNTRLDAGSMAQNYNQRLEAWKDSLRDGADILLYGCNVARGRAGVDFVENLSRLTGADIAASTDLTGNTSLGGDWLLEFTMGAVDVTPVLDHQDALHFRHLLIDFRGDGAANEFFFNETFIQWEEVALEVHNFTEDANLNQPVTVQGLGGDDTFIFKAIPQVGDEFNNSSLDGGDNTDTIDLTQYGNNATNVQFEIRSADANNGDGILARDMAAGTIFPKMVSIEQIRGVDDGTNQYTFFDEWDQLQLTIFNRVDGDVEGTLQFDNSFSFNNAAQKVAIDIQNPLDDDNEPLGVRPVATIDVNHNNINRTVIAHGIRTIRGLPNNHTTLDLSNIDADLTYAIGANHDVTISLTVNAQNRQITVSGVQTLKLGKRLNTLRFEAGASIPAIANPLNDITGLPHYEVALDYTNFGAAAGVNLGPAPNLVNAGGNSTLARDAAVNSTAPGFATWQLYARPSNLVSFDLDVGDESARIESDPRSEPQFTETALQTELNELSIVKAANVVQGKAATILNPIQFNLQAKAAEPPILSAEEHALATLWRDNDTTWRLAIDANEGGNFTLRVEDQTANTQNAAITLNPVRSPTDAFSIKTSLEQALQNLGIAGSTVAVTGSAGTTDSPWQIELQNANGATISFLDSNGLMDDESRFLTLINTVAATPATLDKWTLFTHNAANNGPAEAGEFNLEVQIGGATGRTPNPLRFDAAAEEVANALGQLVNTITNQPFPLGTVLVDGDGIPGADPTDPWTIRFADPDFDLNPAQLDLRIVDASPNLPAMSASGIAGGVNGIPITNIVGTDDRNDIILGFDQNLTLQTGDAPLHVGQNQATGSTQNDTITGGAAVDVISGGPGDDMVSGAGQDDVLSGGPGIDKLDGGPGDDMLFGGPGDDIDGNPAHANRDAKTAGLFGFTGNDTLYGGSGVDLLWGEDDSDWLYGGTGNDVLDGGNQNDHLFGEDGDDTLDGGSQNDELTGGPGADILRGGPGNDMLTGGSENDTLEGGPGNDTYFFADSWGTDTLTETAGDGNADRIDFSKVTRNLTFNIRPLGAAGNVTIDVTSDDGSQLPGVEGIEVIAGGAGLNLYGVANGFTGNLVINDPNNNLGNVGGVTDILAGTLDLSALTDAVTIEISAAGEVKVSRVGLAATVTAQNIENVIVPPGDSRITFRNGGSLPGTLLPPTDGNGNVVQHTVTLDYSQLTGANRPPILNFGKQLAFAQPVADVNSPGQDATQAEWDLVLTNSSGPFSITVGDRSSGREFTTDQIDPNQLNVSPIISHNAQSGTFQLTLNGQQPANTLPFNATADQVKAQLLGLLNANLNPAGFSDVDVVVEAMQAAGPLFSWRITVNDPLGKLSKPLDKVIGIRDVNLARNDATAVNPGIATTTESNIAGTIQLRLASLQHVFVSEGGNDPEVLQPVRRVSVVPTIIDPQSGGQTFRVQLTAFGLIEPRLSSSGHSVATLTIVDAESQLLSIFSDSTSSVSGSGQTFFINLNVNGVMMSTASIVLRGARGDQNVIRNAIRNASSNGNAFPANTDVAISGSGASHDPWLIKFHATGNPANPPPNPVSITNVNTAGLNSRGSFELRHVTLGEAAETRKWTLLNSTHGGTFELLATLPNGSSAHTEPLPFDASAVQIEQALEELEHNNEPLLDSVEVTAAGPSNWIIELAPADFDFGGAPNNFTLQLQNPTAANALAGVGIDALMIDNGIQIAVQGHDDTNGIYFPRDVTAAITLTGADNVDVLAGGAGAQTIRGEGNTDTLSGGSGEDNLQGGDGNDILLGGDDNDTLDGEGDSDQLFGGAGDDTLDGGDGRDTLAGNSGNDQLSGGRQDDTFVFENNWGYDIVREEAEFRNDDALDFSAVTETVTHVLSGSELISGTGVVRFAQSQDNLQSYHPSSGRVTLLNDFGFQDTTLPEKGGPSIEVVADTDVDIKALNNLQRSARFRVVLDFGVDEPRIVDVSFDLGAFDNVNSVADVVLIVKPKLVSRLTNPADGGQPLPAGATFDLDAVGKKLRISIGQADDNVRSASIRVTQMTNMVATGSTVDGSSMFRRFEKIVAANADNRFVFGNDWGQRNINAGHSLITSTLNRFSTALGLDYVTAVNNFFGSWRRELEIDTSVATANGHRVVLDFRQVTKDLEWVFTRTDEGTIELEIGRIEEFNLAGLTTPIPFPPLRFATITITNVDENTIIYTGRGDNDINVGQVNRDVKNPHIPGATLRQGVDFKGTLVGSSGLRIGSAFSVGNWLQSAATLRFPHWQVSNNIDYSEFTFLRRDETAELGGMGIRNSFLPIAGHLSPTGIGNKPAEVHGFENGTLINVFDLNNGGGLLSQTYGTHVILPTTRITPFADDYFNSVPDEFRGLVATNEQSGQNLISIGGDGLAESFIDFLFDQGPRDEEATFSQTLDRLGRLYG